MTDPLDEPTSGQDDELRRALLVALGILDTGPEAAFDGLTLAAAAACACPVAALSVADGEHLWFKSRHGRQAQAVLRDSGVFAGALQEVARHEGALLEVPDLLADPRWRHHAWPGGGPSLRFYAGVPVRVEGLVVGALSVADVLPREPLDGQRREVMLGVAAAAEALLAARRPGAESHGRALRRRQELLSRMSHEMRTPLNAVLGFAQLLRWDPVLAGHQRAGSWVLQIEKASAHLLALVDEMLELARLEAGRQRLAPTRLDLSRVLADCGDMLAPQAASAGVRLRLLGRESMPDWGVTADDRAVRQILINLIGNALQHSPRDSEVVLQLQSRGSIRSVAVSDRGAGIAATDLPRLFQPFERLGGATAGPGTGLGLAISRQLAEALHGAIEVHSELGVGSTFTLHLPAER